MAALALVVQSMDVTRDYKVVAIQFAAGSSLIGLTVWWLIAGPGPPRFRWGWAIAAWLPAWAFFQSVQLLNDADNRIVGWRFRWEPRPDELLALPDANPNPVVDWSSQPRDYPRFLGNGHWAEVDGVALATNWERKAPVEIWRRPLGSGWSSFAIVGDYAFTQEQRGAQELVVCYRLETGDVVWTHMDEARFDPEDYMASLGGPGPRATPTVHEGRVYTQGATGLINCLAAPSGALLWSHDPVAEQDVEPLLWGQSGSPLIVEDLQIVVVSTGAPADRIVDEDYQASLVAYGLETGEVRWSAGHRITSYASPVLTTLAGTRVVVQINQDFVTAHRAEDGEVLWEHPWPGSSSGSASCSQPVPLGDDRLLLTKGYGVGATLLKVTQTGADAQYTVRPLWQPAIKPVLRTKLGNVVVRDGHAYGLNGVILQCVELATGKSKWKARRRPPFGHGQLLLVENGILVLSETGELALVDCSPDGFRELAAVRVLDEDDVTWNNPAFASPYLLVRNAKEAACYKLPLASTRGEQQLPETDDRLTPSPVHDTEAAAGR